MRPLPNVRPSGPIREPFPRAAPARSGTSVRTVMLVWIAVAVVALGTIGGGVLAFTAFDKNPADSVAAIAKDMDTWDGVTVTGGINVPGGGKLDLMMVIDKDDNAKGTLTLGGARIEVATIDGQTLIKGDRAFWQSLSPYPAESVIGRWVKVPPLGGNLSPGTGATRAPKALADQLRAVSDWTEESERTVDGTEGRTFYSPSFGRVVVTGGWTPRLLLVEPVMPDSANASFRMTRADGNALANVKAMASVAANAPTLTMQRPSPPSPPSTPSAPGLFGQKQRNI